MITTVTVTVTATVIVTVAAATAVDNHTTTKGQATCPNNDSRWAHLATGTNDNAHFTSLKLKKQKKNDK